jgi:hypothetical protein
MTATWAQVDAELERVRRDAALADQQDPGA